GHSASRRPARERVNTYARAYGGDRNRGYWTLVLPARKRVRSHRQQILDRPRQPLVERPRPPAELGPRAGVVEGPMPGEALELLRRDRRPVPPQAEDRRGESEAEPRQPHRQRQPRRRQPAEPADPVDQGADRGHVARHQIVAAGGSLLDHRGEAVHQVVQMDPGHLAIASDDSGDAPLEDLPEEEVRAALLPRRP